MPQQDFDNFKQHLKEWKETHPEEYDCFEVEMKQNSEEAGKIHTQKENIKNAK